MSSKLLNWISTPFTLRVKEGDDTSSLKVGAELGFFAWSPNLRNNKYIDTYNPPMCVYTHVYVK